MGIKWSKIKKDLMVNREGIFIGGIIGFMVYSFMKSNGQVIQMAMESQGLIDNFTGLTGEALGEFKLAALLVLLFAVVGYTVDKMIAPNR